MDLYERCSGVGGEQARETLSRGFIVVCWHSLQSAKTLGQLNLALPRLYDLFSSLFDCNLLKKWSGRRDSNPRRPAWEAGILPLNYSRIPVFSAT